MRLSVHRTREKCICGIGSRNTTWTKVKQIAAALEQTEVGVPVAKLSDKVGIKK